MQLWNKTQNKILLQDLNEASSMWRRMIGLLGKKTITENYGLWIQRCNSIHTVGMKFSIDCIFVNKNLVVQKVVTDVKPGNLVLPIWSSSSVIEVAAGLASKWQIQKGDELYVVH